MRREPSETFNQTNGSTHRRRRSSVTEEIKHEVEKVAELHARDPAEQKQSGLLALAVCVGGIYASL
jgi:UDP-galactose transporter B1